MTSSVGSAGDAPVVIDRQVRNEHPEAAIFAGGGEMGARMRVFDWRTTPLGPPEGWPQSLKTAVGMILTSRYPMFVWWGRERINLYNDAYIPILGTRHPSALGRPAKDIWAEIWSEVGPRSDAVLLRGEATFDQNLLLVMERHGYPEETYFTFSYSPVRGDDGRINGVFCACTEETQRVIGERRLNLLRALATAEATSPSEIYRHAITCLQDDPHDFPFALIYARTDEGKFRLAGATGIACGTDASPELVDPTQDAADGWPFAEIVVSPTGVMVDRLQTRFGDLPAGVWARPPAQAMMLPFFPQGRTEPAGVIILGLNPYRPVNEAFRGFCDLVAGQISAAVANALAYETERQRAEALAEIDRAKTTFFSNVSHEFRTPLTLMLGPLEDALTDRDATSAAQRDRMQVAHRNAQRLMKLVNTLLDFTRIEAGRMTASYAPTDLSAVTADIASAFRSAIERAGLTLTVDCPPLPQPVHIDRDMWEKILLNLLSNALKFTFEGEIAVSVGWRDGHAVLTVRDTGTGVPPDQIPHLFERFHRVPNAQARTHEGSGIGLALVHELITLHGGSVRVDSAVGKGTTFSVMIPAGTAHLPADHLVAATAATKEGSAARPYLEEAERWLPGPAAGGGADQGRDEAAPAVDRIARIVVADDNADMRDYLRRLLPHHWRVEAVADGDAALAAIRREKPDLILADVMMPGMDGFALVRALRGDETLRDIRIVLLSARAGEEARVEGLSSGADDYLTKPFAARELIARIGSQLHRGRQRSETDARLRASEAYFRAISDDAPAMIWLTEASGGRTYLNRRWREFTGQSLDESLGLGWVDVVHPDDRERARETFLANNEQQQPFSIDYRLRHHDGTYRWVIDIGMPRVGEDGAFLGYIGSVIDITERKRDEDRLKLLAGEVDHRAKNMLAVVQAIVRMTRADDIRGFRTAVIGRIAALARAHTLLANSKWAGADLKRLIGEELAAYRGNDASRISVSGPPVALDPSTAQTLAMVFHELATNAVKYGALTAPGGRVAVDWSVDAEGALSIVWQESGGPAVREPEATGFGTGLIRRSIDSQLRGQVEFEWHTSGIVCRIRLPDQSAVEPAPA